MRSPRKKKKCCVLHPFFFSLCCVRAKKKKQTTQQNTHSLSTHTRTHTHTHSPVHPHTHTQKEGIGSCLCTRQGPKSGHSPNATCGELTSVFSGTHPVGFFFRPRAWEWGSTEATQPATQTFSLACVCVGETVWRQSKPYRTGHSLRVVGGEEKKKHTSAVWERVK